MLQSSIPSSSGVRFRFLAIQAMGTQERSPPLGLHLEIIPFRSNLSIVIFGPMHLARYAHKDTRKQYEPSQVLLVTPLEVISHKSPHYSQLCFDRQSDRHDGRSVIMTRKSKVSVHPWIAQPTTSDSPWDLALATYQDKQHVPTNGPIRSDRWSVSLHKITHRLPSLGGNQMDSPPHLSDSL